MAYKAHTGSVLPIRNTPIPLDGGVYIYFNFNHNLVGSINPAYPVINHNNIMYTDDFFDEISVKGKHGKGIGIDEHTINIIPNGSVNSYPTYGNTHGTYNTNKYNGNVFFSIGTITSVVDNVVTYVPTSFGMRTYDVVRPQTTGGGLTAGTNYFMKAISPTQFTVHAYNSSQDGSLGFRVHDSIKNDVRIPINATDFPTMWHGGAHLPNSGLVKEVIPNGYKGLHDCLRMHTEFRTDGVSDYMAYGVQAPLTIGLQYAYSFYYRAATPNAIGRVVSFSLHNGVTVPRNIGSFTLEKEWKKFTSIASPTMTGNASMYFPAGAGIAWDIAEIQCEQKVYETDFIIGGRYPTYLSYNIDASVKTISFWMKSNSNKVPTMTSDRPLLLLGNDIGSQAGTYFQCMLTRSDDPRFTSANKIGINMTIAGSSYYCSINEVEATDGNWHFVTVEINRAGKARLFVDGYFAETASYVSDINVGNLLRVGHNHIPSSQSQVYTGLANCVFDDLCVRTEHYEDDEILAWYLSNREFYNPYDYSITV